MNRLFQCLVILLTLLPYLLSGQSIHGIIQDEDAQAMEFVNVLLLNAADSSLVKGMISDEDGSFRFEQLKAGNYLLGFSAIGYKSWYSETVSLVGKNLRLPTIVMQTNEEVLEAVEVVAKKPLYVQEIDRMVINVQNSVTNAGSNALDILERSPGVEIDPINNVINLLGKQGVLILINGKRSRMEASALIGMLRGMDASNIEKIELITTPPAKYDADGDAGIINIVLVKRTDEGLNGSFSANLGYGERLKNGASLNLNFAKGKVNVYGNFSAQRDYIQHFTEINRTVFFEGNNTETYSFSDRPALEAAYRGNFGVDIALSEKTDLGILFSGYFTHWDLDAQTTGYIRDQNGIGYQSDLNSKEVNDWKNGLANIHLGHQLNANSKINFDLDYLTYQNDNPTQYLDREHSLEGEFITDRAFRSRKLNPINFWVGKIDYNYQWSDNITLDLGLKSTISDFENKNLVEDLQNGEWVVNPIFTSNHRLDEDIHAAYTSVNWKFSPKTEVKAGVRYEHIDSDLREINGPSIVKQQYGKWFPSIFLSHQFSDDLQWQVAYNERISRPAFNEIAPALFFWNPTTLLSGNPEIQPSFTKNIKTDIRYKTINFTAQYSVDRQPLSYGLPLVDKENNIMINRSTNIDDRQSLMFSLNSPINWNKTMTTRLSIISYYFMQKSVYEGQSFERNFWYVNSNLTHEVRLPKSWTAEISSRFRSTAKPGLGNFDRLWAVNLGLSKSFENQGARLTLNWTDIFKTANQYYLSYRDANLGFTSDWRYSVEGGIVRLTYSQTFGNEKLRKAKQRAGGSSEERRRVN